MVIDLTDADVLSMTYAYEGETYTFERSGEEWIYEADPSNEVEIVTEGRTYTLYMGNYNDIIGMYYIYVDDPSTVYVVTASVVNSFETGLEDIMVEETTVESTTDGSVDETISGQ